MSQIQDNILIVGGDSSIGQALADHLEHKGINVLKTSRRKQSQQNCLFLDLSNPSATYLIPNNISLAFICAAVASIDQCNRQPDQTYFINVEQTLALSKQLISAGARIVFLSSNVVFDGSKAYRLADEPTCPISEYGKQKAEAERQLLALGGNVTIVRLTKVLTARMPLLNQWIQSLETGAAIHPRNDMIVSPLALDFVVDVLGQLIDLRQNGILQLSGTEDITYAILAKEIARQLECDQTLIQPITQQSDAHSQKQTYTTLDVTAFRNLYKMEPPGFKEVVRSILKSPSLHG